MGLIKQKEAIKMAKFLTLWETDTTRVSESPEEQILHDTMLVNMVKEDLESGKTLDWGMFAGGELRGYCIDEGTELEITMMNMRYVPYIKFKMYPILSVNQVEEMMKALSQG
jgi:hypothetical protein